MSKEYHKSLISLGSSVMSSNEVIPRSYFRYAILKDDILSEVKLFHHPLAIQKLALFIMEAYLETRKRKEQRPMMIFIKNSLKNVYLAAGVMYRQYSYIEKINDFRYQFRAAAEKIETKFTHDGFGTSLIEITTPDFKDFLDDLLLMKAV